MTERDTGVTHTDPAEISAFLARHGIWYRHLEQPPPEAAASDEQILETYTAVIEELAESGGQVTADVIRLDPDTTDLDALMEKFGREHSHAEDEVRLVVSGAGLFHVHPPDAAVFAIEVRAGDAINVPAGTKHWFHLCACRSIRAVRVFVDPDGWVPEYTDSGIDARYPPLCPGDALRS